LIAVDFSETEIARFRVREWEAGHLASATDIDTQEELARL